MHSMSDPSRIPGHGLSLQAAIAAAGSVALDAEDGSQRAASTAHQAGPTAARFAVDPAEADC